MGKKDPRVDAYIDNAADFAKPILKHLRAVIHEACPECQEDIKWRNPAFMYKGMLAGMAAFKQHCAFGFWKDPLVVGYPPGERRGMGRLGKITSLDDLPPKATLMKWTKTAMALNDDGVTVHRVQRNSSPTKKPVRVPADLAQALRKSKKAQAAFAGFSPSHRREYVQWITDAKTDQTRHRRLATAVEWIGDGKHRNWKYE